MTHFALTWKPLWNTASVPSFLTLSHSRSLFLSLTLSPSLPFLVSLCPASGVRHLGELPGYLPAHPGEGGSGQAALVLSPDGPGKGGLLWRGLRPTGMDRLCHGVHQEVGLSVT